MFKTYSLVGNISSIVSGKAPALPLGQLDGSVSFTEPNTTQTRQTNLGTHCIMRSACASNSLLPDTSGSPCSCSSPTQQVLPEHSGQLPRLLDAHRKRCPVEKTVWILLSRWLVSTSFALQVLINTVRDQVLL